MIGELAYALGVDICVEGIERREQYEILEGMKVRMIQGYYFDKPMTKEDFEAKYIRNEE
jgi:EAL domain-containing protein (putative c-di-GMP-specific phosphodiesterase class I)